jgi:NADPH-dependent curcumin reductase CurA
MDAVNHQIRLAARPVGLPKPSDWSHTEESVPEPGEDEVLVEILYLSMDPAMRLDERWPLVHRARGRR